MKAAVYYAPGDVRITQVPEPPPSAPAEVCLRILTASLCGTDASQYQMASMIPLASPHPASGHQGPLILGHEVCGIVVARGSEVINLEVGDRVAVGAGAWCGTCARCREGRPNICEHTFVYGLHAHGGMAERACFPARMCVRVPATCSDEVATLAQPLAVALHALTRAQIQPHMRVAVFGLGGIGSLLLAALAVQPQGRPARLFGLDRDPARLRHAFRALDVDLALNPQTADPLPTLAQVTAGEGVDLAIEATGQPEMLLQALAVLRRGGRLLQVGLPKEAVALPIADMVQREQEMVTTNGQVCPVDLPAALHVLATTDLASRIGITPISLNELVEQGLIPLVEQRAQGKVVVRIA